MDVDPVEALEDRIVKLEDKVAKLKQEVRYDYDLHEGMLHDMSYQVDQLCTEVDSMVTKMENEMDLSDGEGSQN